MPRYRFDDEDVVVIVGSGAGGGTLANELCQKGVKVVVLEAGRHHTPDDFVNDEWRSFKQLAWLDKRTTSGSFRIAKDFPEPARLDVQDGRRDDRPLGRLLPALHAARVQGVDLLRRPRRRQRARLADRATPTSSRTTTAPRTKLGITQTHGIPPMPANNNYKVFANGAQRVGYQRFHSGRYAVNPVPRDGRPATIQDGFTFQGDKVGAKWSTLVAELPKAAGDRQARPARRSRTSSASSTTSRGSSPA